MNQFKHAAWQLLSQTNQPMHYADITRIALEQGLIQTTGKTPESSMNSNLVTDINSLGENSYFIKTEPATYALNPKKTAPSNPFAKAIKTVVPPTQKTPKTKASTANTNPISGGFIGKAGEHWVCAELLMRGFNASIMSVDVGMDIVATKNNQLYSLQVKTSRLHANNTYVFDIREVALGREYSGIVFYVFVMIDPNGQKTCAVIPSSKIDELIHTQAIKAIPQQKVRVTLKVRDDVLFIGTMQNDISYYWNNWSLLKA